jgi:ParB family chromosome partitioning protein
MKAGKVLGRGLGNLIPIGENKEVLSYEKQSELQELPIIDVVPNPNQPRIVFSKESIQELANTIQTHGLIQPIVVQKNGSKYELISGERRLRACKVAGFQKIPAIVKQVSSVESMEMALIENIQREDLNPIDEAIAYRKISETTGQKITELAEKVGKNRATISNLIRLLSLPEPVQNLVRERKLTEGQVRPLLSLVNQKDMLNFANKILSEGWTARRVEEEISNFDNPVAKKGSSSKKSSSKKDTYIMKYEDKIRKKFQLKNEISHNHKSSKGKITFYYNNNDEMENLLSKLGISLESL